MVVSVNNKTLLTESISPNKQSPRSWSEIEHQRIEAEKQSEIERPPKQGGEINIFFL